ncbi:MAG: right-handed parallel beta-helix repeat-containing protein [Chloroflexota bacterium]|nr:right-handed parallel beta-helix repeat-containing protein [Chloroflexota bacterium]MDE2908222.1 right-handed parallel beta-helix repeat-containing protein [Chloroflexota bacterium]
MVARIQLYVLLFLISALGLSVTPAAAQQAVCTLADRIRSANTKTSVGNCPAGTSHDIISFTEDITLTEALPPITDTITIEGGGHTISGDHKHRIFTVSGGRLTINNLTLTKGRANKQNDDYAGGGAIMVIGAGALNINNAVFVDNFGADGGAIGAGYMPFARSNFKITINNSSFLNNNSRGGGAISTIRMVGGPINIVNSSFIRNRASNGGGAISNLGNVIVNVSNSTFHDNSARYGGAINGEVGETTLTHVTMVDNSAHEYGAAISAPTERETYLERATVNLYNSIITRDFPSSDDDCYGRLNESKGNLTDASCTPTVSGEPFLGEQTGSPLYFPLQDGSPALDAAAPQYCLPSDQLGNPRPHGTGCDIGAIESITAIPAPTPIPTICPLDDQIMAANTDTAVGACAAGNGPDTIFMLRDFTLADRLPPITSDITIIGNGFTISGDDKFGIFEVDGGRLAIEDAMLTKGNSGEGGAIRIRNGGQVTVVNVTFADNVATAGGAIATEQYNVRLDVVDSAFHGNRADDSGGAIYTNGGIVTISGSAFQDNSANHYGGAIATANGRVRVINSTLAGNKAAEGGGIYVGGAETSLTHLTLMNNRASQIRGAGIYKAGGLLHLRNSIVAGNGPGDDCYGRLDQNRGNLSQDGSCSIPASGDPLLGKLTGAPAYHPLHDGSPAVDNADPHFCLETDQLGAARPQGGGCDIGAIESIIAASADNEPLQATAECTLADQIIAANTDAPAGACPAGNGADLITLTKNITLSEPLPQINSDITINGNGHTIDGGGRFRIFDIGYDRPSVVIKHLTLVNGSSPGDFGGAIRLRSGELVIADSAFGGNRAGWGGAISTVANTSLKIYNSRLFNNAAEQQGGAIHFGGCIFVDWTVIFSGNKSIVGQDDSREEISIAQNFETGFYCTTSWSIHFRTG